MLALLTQNPSIIGGVGGVILGLVKAEFINKHELKMAQQKILMLSITKEYEDIEHAREYNTVGATINRTIITTGLIFLIIFMTMASAFQHLPYTVVYHQNMGVLGRLWYGPFRVMFKTVYGIVDQPWIHTSLTSIIFFYCGKQRR